MVRLSAYFHPRVVARARHGTYHFERGRWTPVTNAEDALFLLARKPTRSVFLLAEKELGPVWLTCDEAVEAEAKDAPSKGHSVRLLPGELAPLPRYIAHQLAFRRDVRCVGAAGFLEAAPTARIAVIRDTGLGDVLFVGATVDRLREDYPGATIDYVTLDRFNSVVGSIDYWAALERAPYDAIFDYIHVLEAHEGAERLDRIELAATLAELRYDPWPMRIDVPAEDDEFGKYAAGCVVLALTGSNEWRHGSFEWRRSIAEALSSYALVLVGSSPDGYGEIDLTGKTSVGQMVGLVKHCEAVVSVDTGTLYAAQALQKPCVGLFGPIDSRLRLRLPRTTAVLSGNRAAGCGPCNLRNEGCKAPPLCFERIEPDAVRGALEVVLSADPSAVRS